MRILLDTDLLVDIAANRDVNNISLDILERELDSGEHDFLITSLGWSKFESIIFNFADEDRSEEAIDIFQSLISIINVTPHQMQLARALPVDDFESAIEFICAQENDIISILTHQPNNFTKLDQSDVRIWDIDFFDRCIDNKHLSCQSLDSLIINNIFEPINSYQFELLIALSFAKLPYSIEILKYTFCDFSIDSENLLLSKLNDLQNQRFIDCLPSGGIILNEYGRCFIAKNIDKTHIKMQSSIQERIVKSYLILSEKYGGLDYGVYSERYNIIEQEWGNFKVVLEYCYNTQQYDLLKLIWNEVNHFTDLYGLYEDRLIWNQRIAGIAKNQKDWNSYVLHLARQAWVYIIKNKPSELTKASKLLAIADRYFNELNCNVAIYLLQNMFCHRIYMGKYDEAEEILVRQEQALSLNRHKINDEMLLTRIEINILRNAARLSYVKGELESAKKQFEVVLDRAEKFNWLRYVSYTCNKLADIEIDLGNLDEAERYLEIGYPIAQINNNARRKAGHARSYARLEECRGNEQESQRWDDFAKDQWESAGLTRPSRQPEYRMSQNSQLRRPSTLSQSKI
jgi:hypothetical protein